VALALIGSHWGWAADASACAAGLQPRAKVGEGQRRLRCSSHFAGGPGQSWGGGRAAVLALLTLLGLRLFALAGCWG
jgi:hypothetical protein